MNSLLTIHPYKINNTWVFDDEAVGLVKEPFVCGMGEIIDYMVKDIPDANLGVTFIFASSPFPSSQGSLDLLYPESGGNWYAHRESEKIGWLCPALFKYFNTAPKQIFYQVTK